MVETQLCKLRDTEDALIGRACVMFLFIFFFFKQKTAYEIMPSLVGSEMCIRDRSISSQTALSTSIRRLAAHIVPALTIRPREIQTL